MAKKRSLKDALLEFLQSEEFEDDDPGVDDDVITLRGPSARKFLGLVDEKPAPAAEGDEPADGDPAPEPGPQRAVQRRYFDK